MPSVGPSRDRGHRCVHAVYVAYTYDADADPATVTRRTKIVRLTYEPQAQVLAHATDILIDFPAGTDHQGGRLVVGPDQKLYFTIGDLGANQLANFCMPNRSQLLPTLAQVSARDWSLYEGKVLRLNVDGSIPPDNPVIAGVRSHIYSYGLREDLRLLEEHDEVRLKWREQIERGWIQTQAGQVVDGPKAMRDARTRVKTMAKRRA